MPRVPKMPVRGFTLVELLMVLMIVAIIAGIGVPAFNQFVRDGQMTSRANSINLALQLARSEAIGRGRPVTACASTLSSDPPTCDGSNWADGWLVTVDGNASGSSVSVDEVLRVDSSDTKVKSTSASPGFVRFLGDGLRDESNTAGDQTIRLEQPDCGKDGARVIEISATGRARVTKADC